MLHFLSIYNTILVSKMIDVAGFNFKDEETFNTERKWQWKWMKKVFKKLLCCLVLNQIIFANELIIMAVPEYVNWGEETCNSDFDLFYFWCGFLCSGDLLRINVKSCLLQWYMIWQVLKSSCIFLGLWFISCVLSDLI